MPNRMMELYKHIAELSSDFQEYSQNAGASLALICMFEGKVPDGASRKNFLRAWELKGK